jgi:glutathione S-transferase
MRLAVQRENATMTLKLNGFGPLWDLPDLSPFVTKVHAYLRLRGIPYESVTFPFFGLGGAPKGKLPFIEDGEREVADSGFIVDHLERHRGPGLDARLSPKEAAIAHAMRRMVEENLYWVLVQLRWRIDANFDAFMREVFGAWREDAQLAAVLPKVREGVLGELYGHGMGRHTVDEVWELGVRDVDALAAFLGDDPYLMGDAPTTVDASAYSFLRHFQAGFDSPVEARIRSHANLSAYVGRMDRRLFTGPSDEAADPLVVSAA